MKKQKHYLLFILMIVSIYSCENIFDTLGSNEHYKFSNSDQSYLLKKYNKVNEIKKFINQNNDIVNMKIEQYRIEKEGQATPYYYDNLFIQLKLIDSYSHCNTINISISKNKDGKLGNKIGIPSGRANSCRGISYQYKIPEPIEYDMIGINIGNKKYTNVLVFESSPPSIEYLSFYENSTIHKIYFDLKEGIIGFDDLENNLEFRLIN